MTTPLRSSITLLESAVRAHPDADAFRVPQLDPQNGGVSSWKGISYREFWRDVEACALSWRRTFQSQGITRRSVIGLWLHGTKYEDMVHIYSIWRAGYIPQATSYMLPDPASIRDLMLSGGAKALICSVALRTSLDNAFPIPVYTALSQWPRIGTPPESSPSSGTDQTGELPDLRIEEIERLPEETAFLLHTSGSTSGKPKLVPWSFKFVDSFITKAIEYYKPVTPGRQIVVTWLGNACHGGQHLINLGMHSYGSCIVQPTQLKYSSEELKDMILRAGVNWASIFSTYFAAHMKNSRTDSQLLQLLKGLDTIEYGGSAVPDESAEAWAMESKLNLRTIFACTECGLILGSHRGHTRETMLLRPFSVTEHAFVPYDSADNSSKLLEFVILSSSPDCCDISLRSKEDGHYHTGDLFEEMIPGGYSYRGRSDDWIMLYNAFKCDTVAVENNIKAACGDLIQQCVVVGPLRPRLALLVELDESKAVQSKHIKDEIIARIEPTQRTGLLIHEQITDPQVVLIVPSGSLPRTATKGNVRRQAAEEKFRAELDELYGSSM